MAVIPVDRESPFDVGELFFSTTDRRGVIRAGNDVFVRVSRYPEDALVGRAHNVIRHPDMPRAVFRLLWDTIAAGRPIAAYVKNMAADGAHYWVMATVVPARDGYLSVRLKPTGPLLPTVARLYAEVRAAERAMEAEGVPPPEVAPRSLPMLAGLLADAGFPDYPSFMRTALPMEIRAREEAVAGAGRGDAHGDPLTLRLDETAADLTALFADVEELGSVAGVLRDVSGVVRELAEDIRLAATNGIVAAARLDGGGATLAVVADAMSRCAGDVADAGRTVTEQIAPTVGLLDELGFQICTAKVQVDAARQFAREVARGDDAGRRACLAELVECLRDEVSGLLATRAALDARTAAVRDGVRRLEHDLRTMAALQITGRVEVASVPDAAAFRVLFDQVGARLAGFEGDMRAIAAAAAHRPDAGRGAVLAAHVGHLAELTRPVLAA